MNNVIDFNKLQLQKWIKNHYPAHQQLQVEVMINVTKAIYTFMENASDNPFEAVDVKARVMDLLKGDSGLYVAALLVLCKEWKIDLADVEQNVSSLQTVEDMCLYFEKQLTARRAT